MLLSSSRFGSYPCKRYHHNSNVGHEVFGRVVRELVHIHLCMPIRYILGDRVELWLNQVLCLQDLSEFSQSRLDFPAPVDGVAFYVCRDLLFSFRKVSEFLLSRVVRLSRGGSRIWRNGLLHIADLSCRRLLLLLPALSVISLGEFQVLGICELHVESGSVGFFYGRGM